MSAQTHPCCCSTIGMSVTAGSALLCALASFFTRAQRGFAEGASGACRFGRYVFRLINLVGFWGGFLPLCACKARVAGHGS
jgi:hypothetical protein